MEGWIRIHRKLIETAWFGKSEYVHLWLYLLLKANHQDKEVFIGNEKILVKRGQLLTSRHKLAEVVHVQENKIYRILKCFENEHQIEQHKTKKYTVISILNYDTYQKSEQVNEQQMNNKRTTDEQQMNINKNVKNDKNKRITTTVGDSCVDGLQEVIDFYNNNIGMITPYAVEVLEDYLDEMSKDLVILAMKKAVEANKRTIKYTKGILNNWSKKGVKTLADAEREDENFKKDMTKQEEKPKQEFTAIDDSALTDEERTQFFRGQKTMADFVREGRVKIIDV